jgi:hypothetical protein
MNIANFLSFYLNKGLLCQSQVRPLGEGGNGFVMLAKERDGDKYFALKFIPKTKVADAFSFCMPLY